MARPLRLEFPGAIYHGNARNAIFLDGEDRALFLGCLGEVVEECHGLMKLDDKHEISKV